MLAQSYRREVPGYDAFIERTWVRDAHFGAAIVRSRGLAIDYGVIAPAMPFVARQGRAQLTLVLRGRGYLRAGGRVLSLSAGDVVESDQAQTEAEGYAGSPCEVILLEWDARSVFAPYPRTPLRASSIGTADVARLRALAADVTALAPARWVAELACHLGALGAPPLAIDPRSFAPAAPLLARLYAATGCALSRLDAHPSLSELAEGLGLSERHVHRGFAELARAYAHPFEGWRDFLHQMRIDWAAQLLSVRGLSLDRAATLAGFRSSTALFHAFSTRGAATPGAIARRLAEHWR